MRRTSTGRLRWIRHTRIPVISLALWGCLWLSLNAGFWNIQRPKSLDEWQLLIRAILPIAVLPIAVSVVLRPRATSSSGLSPSRLLTTYGFLTAIAAFFSPQPYWSLYWSVAFMATIMAARTFATSQAPLRTARQMLQVTWLVTFLVAAIIAYTARGAVFGGEASAYGINADLNDLSRASGVARWAAVPALVCVLRAFHSRRRAVLRPFFLAAAAAAFYVVYRMQSRGAVFGSAAALLFALLASARLRRYALPCAVFIAALALVAESPAVVSAKVKEYLIRGQTAEEFQSMTGRTRPWEHAITAFWDAPVLGRGQWADRLVIGEHVHNSYLQALLNAGILGCTAYVGSWIAGWVLFIRLYKKSHQICQEDRYVLLESGTVMMFFTVRSIPETTTASFAVDLLVMAAIYVYLETLTVSISKRTIKRSKRMRQQSLLQTANRPEFVA
jgi:O-antigen ligase